MPTTPPMIGRLKDRHVNAVAALHAANLPGLLTSLGPLSVRAYYTGCARTRTATAFVAECDGQVRGFVIGAARPAHMKRRVFHYNRLAIAAAFILALARRPSMTRRMLRTDPAPEEGTFDATSPELFYIAVDAAARRTGIGRALLRAFAVGMRDNEARSYELNVDAGNQDAIAFFEAEGFRLLGQHQELGTTYHRYWRSTT